MAYDLYMYIWKQRCYELVMLAQSLEGTGWNIENKIWRMKTVQMRGGAHKEVSGGTGSPH